MIENLKTYKAWTNKLFEEAETQLVPPCDRHIVKEPFVLFIL